MLAYENAGEENLYGQEHGRRETQLSMYSERFCGLKIRGYFTIIRLQISKIGLICKLKEFSRDIARTAILEQKMKFVFFLF